MIDNTGGFVMFKLIFAGVFFFMFLLALLIGMLKGKRYVWQFSLTRLFIVAVSAPLAVFLSALISWFAAGAMMGFVNVDGATEILRAVPTAAGSLRAIIASVLAPILFFLLFLIIKSVLGIFNKYFCKPFVKLPEKEEVVFQAGPVEIVQKKRSKLSKKDFRSPKFCKGGAALGAVCSLLVLMISLMPMIGFLNMANGFVQIVSAEEGPMKTVAEISDAAAENVGAKTIEAVGGKLVYVGLTTYPVNGKLATLSLETEFISDMGGAIVKIADKDVDRAVAADALTDTQESFGEATMMPMLLSDILSSASDSWEKNEKFCGIGCPALGEDIDPVIKDFVKIMKDSSYDTIDADYATITNTAALVIKEGAGGSLKSSDGVMSVFRNEGLVSGVMLELLENGRTAPLVESITNVGVSVMAKEMGVYKNHAELYDDFVSDMSEAYISAVSSSDASYDRLNTLSDSVSEIYDEHGINITSGVSTCIAASMLNELESGSEEEIKSFVADDESEIQFLSASDKSDEAISLADAIANKVSREMTREQIAEVVKAEFAAFGGICAELTEEELADISEKLASNMYKDISEGRFKYRDAVFSNVKEYSEHSSIITLEELVVVSGEISDPISEAQGLAHMFSSALNIVDDIIQGGYDIDKVVTSFGPVLDACAATHTMGEEQTARLLTAILQSDKVRDGVGFTVVQATSVSNSIIRGVSSGDSYEMLMKSLGKTVEVMKISADDGDATEAITELMQDLTPASAEALQEISTPDMVKKQGVNEKSAEPVANMMSDMFGNMSTAKENGMSEEKYEAEAKAVNDMMSIAMSANKSDGKTLFGAEDSKTGITATDFVDRAVNSEVISETFVNSVYGKEGGEEAKVDPLLSNRQLSDSEKTELVGALNAKWSEKTASTADEAEKAEYQKVLTSIASVVNIQVEFSDSGITEVVNAPVVTE